MSSPRAGDSNPPLSRAVIDLAYRLALGRLPDAESIYEFHLAHGSLAALRHTLLTSDEFEQAQHDLKAWLGAQQGVAARSDGQAPLTRTEIELAYRIALDRPPDAEAIYDSYQSAGTWQFLRASLLLSPEFAELLRLLWRQTYGEQERIAFVHIAKTAGTSLRSYLVKRFGANDTLELDNDSLMRLARDLAQAPTPSSDEVRRFRRARLVVGHFPLSFAQMLPGRLRIITMLREPRARLLSVYYFLKAHRPERVMAEPNVALRGMMLAAQALSLREFLETDVLQVRFNTDNVQLRLLAPPLLPLPSFFMPQLTPGIVGSARTALAGLAGFGLQERYRESLLMLSESLGLEPPEAFGAENVLSDREAHDPDMRPIEREAITPAIQTLLDEHTAQEREFHAFAVELFEQRWQDYRRRHGLQ